MSVVRMRATEDLHRPAAGSQPRPDPSEECPIQARARSIATCAYCDLSPVVGAHHSDLISRLYDRPMVASRALILVIALAFAACSNTSISSPSPVAEPTAEPTPTALHAPSSTPVPSQLTSPSAGVDPAIGLQIAPPYELEPPSGSDLDGLSGNILGLASDLARSAGAGYAPTDFPMGFRFIRDADKSVGVIVLLGMPAEVAERPGLLESIATAVAAEVNAVLSYETIQGANVAVVRGPIASTVAILHGHLVMAQTGQPAVDPEDLMSAVIAANGVGFAAPTPKPS